MDKDKELITAKTFFEKHFDEGKTISQILVLFAKYHRERTIEAIKEKALIIEKTHKVGELIYEQRVAICPDSIENAYKETEIK